MQNRAAERQALLPAAGQRRDQRVLASAEAGHLDGEAHALGAARARGTPIDAAEEAQVLRDGQVAIEREFLRHVADVLAHRLRGRARRRCRRPGRARRSAAAGRRECGSMVDLPAPLGPRKPMISPRRDLEADMIDRDEGAEALDQILGDDLRRRRAPSPVMPLRPSSSRSATKTSSMLGSATAMLAEGNARRCERLRSSGMRRAGVVDDGVNAVADQHHAADAVERPRSPSRTARPVGRRDRDERARHARLQRRRRVAVQHAAAVQQSQAVAALGLVEIGGRDQDGHALVAQAIEDAPEIAARHRIDAGRRLVEQQDLRRVNQRAGEAELLLHAARELAGEPLAERRSCPKPPAAAPRVRRAARGRHLEQIGVEADVLVDGQIFVEAEPLRHVADVRLDALRVGDDVDAVDDDAAGVRAA